MKNCFIYKLIAISIAIFLNSCGKNTPPENIYHDKNIMIKRCADLLAQTRQLKGKLFDLQDPLNLDFETINLENEDEETSFGEIKNKFITPTKEIINKKLTSEKEGLDFFIAEINQECKKSNPDISNIKPLKDSLISEMKIVIQNLNYASKETSENKTLSDNSKNLILNGTDNQIGIIKLISLSSGIDKIIK